ncbi:MAG TPA: ABC transporter ATP-binding protein [Mycobacterium sp.]|jgi:ABC-type multidrug transport system fused ATPase/permease subunit
MPSTSQRAYVWRSIALLRTVRGPVMVTIALGLLVSALPFVSNAAFGPLMQGVADAGMAGHLSDVWATHGPLLSTPLPFAVLLVIWGGSLVLAQAVSFVNTWIQAQVQWKLLSEIRQRVYDHIQSLSLDFFTSTRSGALLQRVQVEVAGVQRLLTDCLIPPTIDGVVLVGALIYLLVLSWQMTIVSLILSPVALIALRYAGMRLQGATQEMLRTHRQMSGELAETISGIADIQLFNAQQRRSTLFGEESVAAAKTISLIMIWAQAGARGVQVFVALSTVLVLIVGVVFSASFGLTFASLVVFVSFVPTMFAAAQRMVQAYTTYYSTIPNVVATYDLLDTAPTVAERPDAVALADVHGNLVFEDVVFGYSPDHRILDGVSFSVEEGETVALVGAIGSGKSTIFNLLLRFLDPEHGRILLDGREVGSVTLSSLRDQVSKLAQFPFFLKDTITENVRLAKQDATNAEVEEACELAHIHSVIVDRTEIPDGYDTVVDVQVPSGGQKRLIALARCLLRKPEVLLLDEPTENLDADQRSRLTRVIREYARNRTCIVISHDMDFIAAVADRIVVMGDGRVAEAGTHEELMTNDGLYKRLYDAQNVDPALVRGATSVAG